MGFANKSLNLKTDPLLFDKNFLNEFSNKYSILRKKYITLLTIGFGFFFAGGTIIFLFEKGLGVDDNVTFYHSISTLMIAIGVYIFAYFASMMDAYELIVRNEEHINKLSFKLLKKLREKKAML